MSIRIAFVSVGVAALLAACVANDADEETGQAAEPIAGSACVLTSYDGYDIFRRSCSDGTNFYTSDGNTPSSSGVRTGLEWQCVEWTNRYFHFHWGTPLPWYGNATDKCTNHPSSVSTVSTPWWGDAVVFRPGACLAVSSSGSCLSRADATYGHIGLVIGFPSSTTMRVKDQNAAQNSYNDYIRAAVHGYPNPVQCYLRDSHHVCQAASTRSCTAGGCSGTQTCASTGRSWGACVARCADAGGSDAHVDATADVGASDVTVSDAHSDAGSGAGDARDGARSDVVSDGAGAHDAALADGMTDAAFEPDARDATAGDSDGGPRGGNTAGGCSVQRPAGRAAEGLWGIAALFVVLPWWSRRRRKKAG